MKNGKDSLLQDNGPDAAQLLSSASERAGEGLCLEDQLPELDLAGWLRVLPGYKRDLLLEGCAHTGRFTMMPKEPCSLC